MQAEPHVKTRMLLVAFVLALPTVARAQSTQTYCHTGANGEVMCTAYGSDGSTRQTYCLDSSGKNISCNSYGSDGSTKQTYCHDASGNGVNCTSYGSDGSTKQTYCRDTSGNGVNCTSYGSDGSTKQTYCHDTFGNSVTCTSYGSDGASSQTQIAQQPVCDAACQQARYQQNYQAGYALGQALGTVVGAGIEAHRKHKFCKDHPNGGWKYEDGTWATCQSINAKHEDRQYMASPEVESQLRSNADQAQGLMEVGRRNIVDIHGRYSDVPELQAMLPKMQTGWLEMRNIFCGYYRTGVYTDLDGKQQTCDGRPSQSGSSPQTTGDNLTASDLACQSRRPGQYVKIGGKKSMCYYGIDDKMHASR